MKIQNPSFKIFLNRRTHGRTDGQAKSNMLPTFSKWGDFFKVGGIKKKWWEPQYLANPPNLILSGVTHYTFAKKLSHLSNLVSQIF